MATIAELLIQRQGDSFNWEWIQDQLQKEAARTYFPAIKMAPARVCVNAWATYRLCKTVTLDDVMCSPVMSAVGSEETVPDPAVPSGKKKPDVVRDKADQTYQADPNKYIKTTKVSEAVLLCSAMVDIVLDETRAPGWFLHWLDWRYPETGRFATSHKTEGRELCYEWARDAGGRLVCGGFVTDTYALRSVSSLVQKMDSEFMAVMRERFRARSNR